MESVDLQLIFDWFRENAGRWLSSKAFIAFIASVCGAAAGAWGAQAAINRSQNRQAMIKELNAVRSATLLCFTIANSFITFKAQLTKPMREKYDAVKGEFEAFTGPAREFRFEADWMTITAIKVPISQLEQIVFEGASIDRRGLAALVQLSGSIDSLEKSVQLRNELVASFKSNSPTPHNVLLEKYLGLRSKDGVIDQGVAQNINALSEQVDDCIFYAMLLADDLIAYNASLRKENPRRYRKVPNPGKADWTIAREQGLLPDPKAYEPWLRGFPLPPQKTRSLWFQRGP
jgi:hypothetical protein